jgi:hypothetical protein
MPLPCKVAWTSALEFVSFRDLAISIFIALLQAFQVTNLGFYGSSSLEVQFGQFWRAF